MNILYLILVLLVVTRVFAELAERIRVPAIVGELVAGVALGLVLKRYAESWTTLSSATQSEGYESLVNLGMFFLMLLAGIRMEPIDFARTSRSAILVALGGMIVPVVAGFALGIAVLPESPFRFVQSLFLGTALAITAVPVTMRIFMDLDELDSRVGKTVVTAALWDDLISLFLLALLLAAIGESASGRFELESTILLLGKVCLYFAITVPVGLFLFPRIGRRLGHLHFPEVDFSILLIAALAYAVFAEYMDLHFILGAFLAGLFFHPNVVDKAAYRRVEQQMSGITRGFLAPVFFVSVGLHLDFSAIAQVPWFLAALILAAFISKLFGSGIPAYWVGLSKWDAAVVGIGMSGRGAVELIVAGVALQAGLFSKPVPVPVVVESLYSSIVIMALVTTVLTPIFLRWMLQDNRRKRID